MISLVFGVYGFKDKVRKLSDKVRKEKKGAKFPQGGGGIAFASIWQITRYVPMCYVIDSWGVVHDEVDVLAGGEHVVPVGPLDLGGQGRLSSPLLGVDLLIY